MKILVLLLSFTLLLNIGKVAAQENSNADTQKSVANQIQQLKRDVIALNRDLFVLEEDLLFPSSTQVVVYLSMDVGTYFKLDAVELKIDDQAVTHYLYTDKQVDALYRGGTQRLHVDNLTQGEHQLTAFLIGLGPESREFKRATTLTFIKGPDAATLEIQVIDSNSKQQPEFKVVEL